jgi:predicted enzyme related to lactoylglutathione lyase
MIAFEVDDFEKAISELKQAGVPVHYDSTETPICHFAIFRDPDDNALMIHKRKPGND